MIETMNKIKELSDEILEDCLKCEICDKKPAVFYRGGKDLCADCYETMIDYKKDLSDD